MQANVDSIYVVDIVRQSYLREQDTVCSQCGKTVDVEVSVDCADVDIERGGGVLCPGCASEVSGL
jgi:DNA-directed RNA polymerase subunit RPC12/RpoP